MPSHPLARVERLLRARLAPNRTAVTLPADAVLARAAPSTVDQLALVRPFHPAVVRAILRLAAGTLAEIGATVAVRHDGTMNPADAS